MSKLNIEYIKTGELIPYVNNPRNNENAVDVVAGSIKEFGFKNPIIIDKDNVIIAGHTRLLASRKLGLEEVPVIRAEDLTEQQVKAFRIADNKTTEFAEWDIEMLAAELEGLEDMFTGFDANELTDLFGDKQEIVEDDFDVDGEASKIEEPASKQGDVWLLGRHRLMCGDATKKEDVERLMDGKKADMVFTDPPYGLGGYAGRSGKFNAIKGDDEDVVKFYQCIPKTKERYIWGNWQVLKTVIQEQPRDVIVWVKNNFGMGKGYRGQYEICFYFGNFDGSDSDVWQIDKDVNYKHPTQKPVALAARAIKNSSKLEDIVLDLFGGSGSTLIACEQLNRTCYMMEIDPVYVDVIKNRWEHLTGLKAEKTD